MNGRQLMTAAVATLVLATAAVHAGPVEDGRAALEAHDPALAQQYFQQALDADPDDPDANYGMALAETALLVNDPGQDIVDIHPGRVAQRGAPEVGQRDRPVAED